MTVTSLTSRRQNLLGSLWMVLSMAAFSVEDVFLKLAGGSMPVSQVMAVFGTFGILLFAILCATRRQNPFARALWHRSILLRFWFEMCGRLFFTLSLVLTAISSTVAILQATPLVVVAGLRSSFASAFPQGAGSGFLSGCAGSC